MVTINVAASYDMTWLTSQPHLVEFQLVDCVMNCSSVMMGRDVSYPRQQVSSATVQWYSMVFNPSVMAEVYSPIYDILEKQNIFILFYSVYVLHKII